MADCQFFAKRPCVSHIFQLCTHPLHLNEIFPLRQTRKGCSKVHIIRLYDESGWNSHEYLIFWGQSITFVLISYQFHLHSNIWTIRVWSYVTVIRGNSMSYVFSTTQSHQILEEYKWTCDFKFAYKSCFILPMKVSQNANNCCLFQNLEHHQQFLSSLLKLYTKVGVQK